MLIRSLARSAGDLFFLANFGRVGPALLSLYLKFQIGFVLNLILLA